MVCNYLVWLHASIFGISIGYLHGMLVSWLVRCMVGWIFDRLDAWHGTIHLTYMDCNVIIVMVCCLVLYSCMLIHASYIDISVDMICGILGYQLVISMEYTRIHCIPNCILNSSINVIMLLK